MKYLSHAMPWLMQIFYGVITFTITHWHKSQGVQSSSSNKIKSTLPPVPKLRLKFNSSVIENIIHSLSMAGSVLIILKMGGFTCSSGCVSNYQAIFKRRLRLCSNLITKKWLPWKNEGPLHSLRSNVDTLPKCNRCVQVKTTPRSQKIENNIMRR